MVVKKGGYIKHDLVLSLVNVLYLCAPDNHNFLQKTKEREWLLVLRGLGFFLHASFEMDFYPLI